VQLTEAGVRFVEQARKLLEQFDHLRSVASRAQTGEMGHLAVGCVTSYKRYLVECVQAFSQKYPDVRLEFHSMGTDEQAKALKQGRIHVGFVNLPVHISELVTERISSYLTLLWRVLYGRDDFAEIACRPVSRAFVCTLRTA
jgi:DNA-binding transcriptional LysR family regulator